VRRKIEEWHLASISIDFAFNPWYCAEMNPIIYRGDILLKSQKDNSTTYYFIGSQEGDTD
jgi:hypothetical protein